jgi:hypothetical protein
VSPKARRIARDILISARVRQIECQALSSVAQCRGSGLRPDPLSSRSEIPPEHRRLRRLLNCLVRR